MFAIDHKRLSVVAVLIIAFLLSAIAVHASGTVFIVNSTTDGSDISPGDGLCETGSGNGVCTFRAAIEESNALSGADTVSFAIPGSGLHTISLISNLPTITGPITIDGTTQPGTACGDLWAASPRTLTIAVDGGGVRTVGLDITSNNSSVRGIAFTNFVSPSTIINLNTAHSVAVTCNNLSNGENGIGAEVGASDLQIGGPNAGDGNVISSITTHGMHLKGIENSLIEGNFVGVDATGSAASSCGSTNSYCGSTALFFGIGADSTMVKHNLFSGSGAGINVGYGVGLPFIQNTTIVGNYIGTDRTGLISIPNATGIVVGHASNTTIGGTNLIDRNMISGNGTQAIMADASATSVAIMNNYIGVTANAANDLCNGSPQVSNGSMSVTAYGNRYGNCGNGTSSFSLAASPSSIIDDGDELTFSTTGAPSSDSGVLSLYVCKTPSGTPTGCAGGVSDTWCSAVGATSNPSCSFTPTSSDAGVRAAYAYIYSANYDVPNSPIPTTFVVNTASDTGINTSTFLVNTAADNATVYKTSNSYPPGGAIQTDVDGAGLSVLVAARTQAIPNGILNMLLRFDTSSLPDTAIVTRALFSCLVSPNAFFNTDNRNLTADWYRGPLGSTAYNKSPLTTALAKYPLSSVSVGSSPTLNTILLDTTGGVSLTGPTALRFHIDGGVPVDEGGVFSCDTYGHGNPAALTVAYTIPPDGTSGGRKYNILRTRARGDGEVAVEVLGAVQPRTIKDQKNGQRMSIPTGTSVRVTLLPHQENKPGKWLRGECGTSNSCVLQITKNRVIWADFK